MDIATAALTPVSEGEAPASVSGARFTPDGRGVLLVTNRDSEFQQLRRVDLATGAVETLTSHIPWDIDSFARSDDGRYLAWVANVDGMSRLTVLNVASRTEIAAAAAGWPDRAHRIRSHRQEARRCRWRARSRRATCSCWSSSATRWFVTRRARPEPIDPLQFVPAELVRFPTFDRENGKHRQIPAFVYRPRHARPAPGVSSTSTAARNPSTRRASTRSRSSWCARWASR